MINKIIDFNGILDIITFWSNTILGTLMGIIVIFAIWKLIIISISILYNADNPENRAEGLNSLKWPIIIIIFLLIMISIMNVIIQIVKNYNIQINN